ncbi:hypothetical protein ASG01_15295 [Chryseobacterium sp. Leaf180]|nr:hypothetical protein ASG01_15295 [Chryseobacterium sp. Leaf180]
MDKRLQLRTAPRFTERACTCVVQKMDRNRRLRPPLFLTAFPHQTIIEERYQKKILLLNRTKVRELTKF